MGNGWKTDMAIDCDMCAMSIGKDHNKVCHYNLLCVDCAARLVAFGKGFKQGQSATLEAISRVPGAPGRKSILQAMKDQERAFLFSEITMLKELLSELPEGNVLERVALAARLRSAEKNFSKSYSQEMK